MISMTFTDVPTPPAIEVRIGANLPKRVLLAAKAATTAVDDLPLCLGADARDELAFNLHTLAAANKILAAYNPGLIVRIGGAS